MAELGFDINAEDYAPLPEKRWDRLRELAREEVDDEGGLSRKGRAVILGGRLYVFPCRHKDESQSENGEAIEGRKIKTPLTKTDTKTRPITKR